MNTPETEFFYPNRMGRILLQALEEILGPASLRALLDRAEQTSLQTSPAQNYSFHTIAALGQALEAFYGPRGGRGLALRAGRACFGRGLREFGPLLGVTDAAFRLLPWQTRLTLGANALSGLFNKHSDQRVRLEETPDSLLWHIERCPLCWERQAQEPVCHLAAGLLQESLYWLSGGKLFDVQEVSCHAQGDANCTFRIPKTPLGG